MTASSAFFCFCETIRFPFSSSHIMRPLHFICGSLQVPEELSIDGDSSLQDESTNQWLQWMKTAPAPLFLELTSHVRDLVVRSSKTSDPWVSDEHLAFVDMSLEEYAGRIACHVILLPSGSETAPLSLVESTGAHVYGKLLYGGVSRFRLLRSGRTVRRVGEKREVVASNEQRRSGRRRGHPSWVQLGGLERRYAALDIGPAAVLEITLLPRLWQDLPTVFDKGVLMGGASADMTLSGASFPASIVRLSTEAEEESNGEERDGPAGASVFESAQGKERNDALRQHFQSRVGGLRPQIDAIVRRVLDGRSVYATSGDGASEARLEAEELASLGLQPVRGMLLYGKPG